ncbi:MAG: hypothetical protein LBR80_04725 [Deltaproteobacteria bacterium]|nr:hypothetical protein [Deltaproteobacteria bacterium]
MKLYLAGSVYNLTALNFLAQVLEKEVPGLKVISAWLTEGDPAEDLETRWLKDVINGVEKADAVLATFPYGDGTLCEMAYGAGLGKHVVYFRDSRFADEDPLITGGFKLTETPTDSYPDRIKTPSFEVVKSFLARVPGD